MEDIAFFLLFLLTINNMSLKGYNNFFKDYADLKNVLSVRGIFVWLIFFFNHNKNKNNKQKYINEIILKFLGQKLSSMFFFYSGYGIYESIKTKNKYVKYLPKKALNFFIKMQIIHLLYLIRNSFFDIYEKNMTFKNLFLSIFLKSTLGNSNWFIYNIILYYLYAFISFIFIKNKKYNFLGAISLIIFCILHVFFTYYLYQYKKLYYVDNALPFILGILYSLIRKYSDKLVMINDFIYYGIVSSFIIILYVFYIHAKDSLLINNFINGTFSITIILITMKVRLDNEFLKFLNIHSFSIYLLQNLILQVCKNKNLFNKHEFIRIFIEFLFTIFFSTTFDFIMVFIDKYFKREDGHIKNIGVQNNGDSVDKINDTEMSKSIPNILNLNN